MLWKPRLPLRQERLRVSGLGFGVQGLGARVEALGGSGLGLGFGLGCRGFSGFGV